MIFASILKTYRETYNVRKLISAGPRLGSSLEAKKRRIMNLVDLSAEPWRKAAFYSNSEAVELVSKLYERWESSKRVGNPLDYATEEELDRLILIAENIEPSDIQDQQVRTFIAAIYGEEVLEEMEKRGRKRSRVARVIRKIFFLE
jgi:hypothetical protein